MSKDVNLVTEDRKELSWKRVGKEKKRKRIPGRRGGRE